MDIFIVIHRQKFQRDYLKVNSYGHRVCKFICPERDGASLIQQRYFEKQTGIVMMHENGYTLPIYTTQQPTYYTILMFQIYILQNCMHDTSLVVREICLSFMYCPNRVLAKDPIDQ